MASSYFSKLEILIKKNFILMTSDLMSILLEILFPVVIMFIIICLREAFPIESHSYEVKNPTIETFIKENSFSHIVDIGQKDSNYFPNTHSWLGLNVVPPLQICSSMNNQSKLRPLIASIGIPSEIKDKMVQDSLYFSAEINFQLSINSFLEFNSIDEMENYIKSEDYLKNDTGLICFGLRFSYDEVNKLYDYSLHFFDTKYEDEGIEDIENNNNGLFDRFQSGPDLNSFEKYKNGAYAYMIKIVYDYILNKEKNDANEYKINYGIIAMKYTDYRRDYFGEILGYLIGFIIVISTLGQFSLYLYRFVNEKEKKVKGFMKIMGLGESEYFLSYFIQYLIISIIISFINTFLLQIVLRHIPFYFLFILIFLYYLNIFSLAYFFQSFFDTTKIAITISIVIYFIMYCSYYIYFYEKIKLIYKILLSVLPPICLNSGILLFSKFEYHFRHFNNEDFWINHYNFSIAVIYLIFLIDFFIYLILGCYLNKIIPFKYSIQKPWYFLCSCKYWCNKGFKKDKNINTITNIELKLEEEELYDKSDKFEYKIKYDSYKIKYDEILKIRKITKKIGNKKILDNINLNIYRNEIFTLIGENGSGKSALISILVGILKSDKGEVLYNKRNILNIFNMELLRKKIGFCPKQDILFDNLSIREHLELFGKIKDINSEGIKENIDNIISIFQLEDKQYVSSKKLSQSERRKLSIILSLIGENEFLFLDQPTNGLDMNSKKILWDYLKYQCIGKFVIVMTHDLEEAIVLSNRIGIIHYGQIYSVGSLSFLIEKFAKNMNLIVKINREEQNNIIVDFIKSNLSENIIYEIIKDKIIFKILIEEFESKKTFLEILEKNMDNLNIKSYSISMPSLSDALLNIQPKGYENDIDKDEENQFLFEKYIKNDSNIKCLTDLIACLKRKILVSIKDFKQFITDIICPILLICLCFGMYQIDMKKKSFSSEVNIDIMGKQIIPIYDVKEDKLSQIMETLNNYENITSIHINKYGLKEDNLRAPIKQYIEDLYNLTKDNEESKEKTLDMTKDNYIGYYSSILILNEDIIKHKYQYIIALNTRIKHCIPIYLNFLYHAIFESLIDKKIKIKFTHYPMPLTFDLQKKKSDFNKIILIILIGISFSIISGKLINVIVKEKDNKSKHFMILSGMNIFSYWFANFFIDLIYYYFIAGICILILWALNFYVKYLYIFYLIYGPGMISLSHLISFLFSNEISAQIAMIFINIIFGILGLLIVLSFRFIDSLKLCSKILEYIFSLVPMFCFNYSYNYLFNYMKKSEYDFKKDWISFEDMNEIINIKFNLIFLLVIYGLGEFIIYYIILIIIECNSYSFKKIAQRKDKSKVKYLISKESYNNEEIKNNDTERPLGKIKDEQLCFLKIKNLEKINYYFIYECCHKKKSRIFSLENINLNIQKNECFGILGSNGSGKTTILKCITQEIVQTDGTILIDNKDINGKFNQLKGKIGFYPQNNIIFEELSVYNNLEFYAKIKGIHNKSLTKVLNRLLKLLNLYKYKNETSGNLSEGNKRKLCFIISILCNPPLILLDSPILGVDVQSKYIIYSLINKLRKISTIVLSTQALEEAELLCDRIGFLNKGNLNSEIPLDLITKKNNDYEINVKVRKMNEEELNKYLSELPFEKEQFVNNGNVLSILQEINKQKFYNEFEEGKIGENIYKLLNSNSINVVTLLNWIFTIENALRFIKEGKEYFKEIILIENYENNFIFKIKKRSDKNIGRLLGIFENCKEKYYVIDYSIKETYFDKIFNEISNSNKDNSNTHTIINTDNIINTENESTNKNNIIIDDELFNELL